MTYLTGPFMGFVFAVAPYWLPLLAVYLVSIYLLIMRERFDPRSFIFWMAIVLTVPFLGFVLYLLFGSTIYSRRRFRRKPEEDARFLSGEGDEPPASEEELTRVLREAGADVYTSGNGARMFWGRQWMDGSVVADLESAESSIHMMFRRFPQDADVLEGILARKASEGVDVRVMTSSRGFGRTRGLRRLRAAGVRFCTFNRPLYATLSLKPANRNIRAMGIIDGRVAYQGRGAVVRLEGPAAARLELRFRADWLHGSGEDLGSDVPEPPRHPGGAGVQAVSDGPDAGGRSPMAACYTELITRARERLHISFPYLLPNDELYSAVKLAVLSGVEVVMLLPARGRHWYQSWNSLAASNPLMMAGARVHFADRSLGKCVIVADGEVCCIGSGDYSGRALHSDFNTCCVIHSRELAEEAERRFAEELEDAAECLPEEYTRRSFADRVRIAVARFFMFLN